MLLGIDRDGFDLPLGGKFELCLLRSLSCSSHIRRPLWGRDTTWRIQGLKPWKAPPYVWLVVGGAPPAAARWSLNNRQGTLRTRILLEVLLGICRDAAGAVDDPDGLDDVKRAIYRSLVLGSCERQPPDAEPTGDDEPSYVDRLLGPEIAPEVLLATSLWYLWPTCLFFRTWSLYTTRSSTR